jgi:hypothetical protein
MVPAISSGSYIFVGAGRGDNTPATTTLDAVNLTGGSLVLSRLQVTPSAAGAQAVLCSSSANLYLSEVVVNSNGGRGVDATTCSQITVDRTLINGNGNPKYGLIIGSSGGGATSYTVVNSAVVGSGNSTGMGELYGVFLNTMATPGTFSYSTLAYNESGITCAGGQNITNTIVSLNTKPYVAGTCGSDPTVISNLTAGSLGPAPAPKLMSSDTSCIDKGSSPYPMTDYFGTTRPLGQGPDIGYMELQ